jgi:hypothetical protein
MPSVPAMSFTQNPENPVTANPVENEVVAGSIADVGVSVGISDLSGTGGKCEGYSINIGSGKYGGVQITDELSNLLVKSRSVSLNSLQIQN